MLLNRLFLIRTLSTTKANPKICIVGSGPAGFYAAQHLSKKLPSSEIDIYERLPVPFGLVRFGVAPDHPDVKNVISTFTKTAQSPNVRFVGNVSLGQDVSLQQLRAAYHVVLLAYGAEENRTFNIPGEGLANVLAARNIVGWYNGLPSDRNLDINLNGETVAIFGQGNVAVDVARILLTPIDELKKTDITEYALDALSKSKVKHVQLIGRRGPLQVAFTIAEFREMLKLTGCETILRPDDFATDNKMAWEEVIAKLARPRKRLTQLMLDALRKQGDCTTNHHKRFSPIFYRSPLEMHAGGKSTKIESVQLGVNELIVKDGREKAVLTDRRESIECELAVSSIGYKSIQADKDIPFDGERGVAATVNGKIEDGLYACGWLATGPTGVILTTMNNAFGVASDIVKDVEAAGDTVIKPGYEDISKVLAERNVQQVSWEDWLKIDEFERNEGEKNGKCREKVVDVRTMLEIAAR